MEKIYNYEYNCSTGETIVTEVSEEEIAERIASNQLMVDRLIAENEARASERSKVLARLGITEEQARLLLSQRNRGQYDRKE